jgi:hypothetical protein
MKWNITFTEKAKLEMEQLIKQIPVTLQEAKNQAKWLSNKKSSMVSNKKK